MSSDERLLSVEDLRVSFEGLVAVDDITFQLQPGEIVGLIGPNGAGKTTTFDSLTGFTSPDRGTVLFKGEDVTGSPAYARARKGMVRTFQITRELTGMRVLDNMLLGGQGNPGESVIRALLNTGSVREYQSDNRQRAKRWLQELDLWDLHDQYAGNLSGGQRRLLELGRALMADPDLLLLDEPMAGVNPNLTQTLLDRIRSLRNDRELTFLIVEHDLEMITSISDRVIAMHNGRIIAQGTPEEITQDQDLLDAYLGGGTLA